MMSLLPLAHSMAAVGRLATNPTSHKLPSLALCSTGMSGPMGGSMNQAVNRSWWWSRQHATRARTSFGNAAVQGQLGRRHLSASGGSSIGPLVSVDWLADNLDGVKVVDASWYMPAAKRDPYQEFRGERLPGSVFLDIDGVADTSIPLPHMLPTPEQFASAMDALAISRDNTIVIYDGDGLFSCARAWWTFRTMGHERVAVLSGGMPAWKAAGQVVETDTPAVLPEAGKEAAASPKGGAAYQGAAVDPAAVRSVVDMLNNVESAAELVVDARSKGRWEGTAPEPRAGLRGGRIPGSRSLPFDTLVEGGALRPPAEIRAAFEAAGAPLGEGPLVASCGTGVTASVLALAAEVAEPGQKFAVYDGSWTEWGGREDTPVDSDA